jgi:pimeloyl-ACP methyl ester carboxylesterase
MPFVTVNGETLHYTDNGGAREGALLLIHGSGGSHKNWPSLLREQKGPGVIALDLPGHGLSQGKGRDSVDAYADVADAAARALGLSRAVVCGHSLGSAIALALALRYPPWLAKLILVGAGARLRVMPVIFELLKTDYAKAIEMTGAAVFGPGAPPDLIRETGEAMSALPWQVLYGDFTACDRFDVMARLGEITLPTLVVAGDKDVLTPLKYGRRLADNIQGARLVVLEGAGHLMAMEKPEEFVRAVGAFAA